MSDQITKLQLIINPISGSLSKEGLDRKMVEILEEHGFDVDVAMTEYAGHATELARRAVDAGYDGVLVCGGDGTINETALAMIGTDVPMGIIPAGSGNGLARHLEIPMNPIESLRVIAERNIRACDYGEVNGHPFFCTFGIGFDAAVSDRFAMSHSRGKMTYVRSAFQEFADYQALHYHIVADGEEIDTDAFLIAVCNAAQYGNNAYIAPEASLVDGKLDLVIVPKITHLGILALGVELITGSLNYNKKVIRRQVSEVTIMRESGPAHLDGEPFNEVGNIIKVKCHPGQLKLFTTGNPAPFQPYLTPMRATAEEVGLAIKYLFNQ